MIYKATEPIYFVGDLHGNFHWLKAYIERYNLTNCSLVFCGDVGLGFRDLNSWFGWIQGLKLDKCLKKRKIECFFVRGNHDNPNWFDDKTLTTSIFKAVSDYSVISTDSHNILCVGGGISIDRSDRRIQNQLAIHRYLKYHPHATVAEAKVLGGQEWWENEPPFFDETAISKLTLQIDTVCSHVAPTWLPPEPIWAKTKWTEVDPDLNQDCLEERQVLDKVLETLSQNQHPLANVFYGHYHRYLTTEARGITGHLLDMARDGNLCMKELHDAGEF